MKNHRHPSNSTRQGINAVPAFLASLSLSFSPYGASSSTSSFASFMALEVKVHPFSHPYATIVFDLPTLHAHQYFFTRHQHNMFFLDVFCWNFIHGVFVFCYC